MNLRQTLQHRVQTGTRNGTVRPASSSTLESASALHQHWPPPRTIKHIDRQTNSNKHVHHSLSRSFLQQHTYTSLWVILLASTKLTSSSSHPLLTLSGLGFITASSCSHCWSMSVRHATFFSATLGSCDGITPTTGRNHAAADRRLGERTGTTRHRVELHGLFRVHDELTCCTMCS